MSWRDNLRQGSFRGVEFKTESTTLDGGRRAVNHEFPNREIGMSEDLGKKSESFSISAYVLGADYMEQRDALIDALNVAGPGELIHPYYGRKIVQSNGFSISESSSEGGICKISLKFIDAGEAVFPTAVTDKKANLESAVKNANEATKKEFDESFSIVDAPQYAVDFARSAVELSAETFKSATSGITSLSDKAANFAYGVKNLSAEAESLVNAPALLSSRVQQSIGLIESLDDDPSKSDKAFTKIAESGFNKILPSAVTGTESGDTIISPSETPSRIKEKENNDEYNYLIQRTCLISQVSQASTQKFDSADDAKNKLDELQITIHVQIQSAKTDELFQALSDLFAALVEVLADQTNEYDAIVRYTPDSPTPALVIAHDVFEKIDIETNLINRNNILHPGFVPAGQAIEVINV